MEDTQSVQCQQNNDPLVRGPPSGPVHGPPLRTLRQLTIKNENEACCDRINSKRDSDKFWRQFSLISLEGGNLTFKSLQICYIYIFYFFLLGFGWAGRKGITTFFSIVMWEGIFGGGLGEQSHFCSTVFIMAYVK